MATLTKSTSSTLSIATIRLTDRRTLMPQSNAILVAANQRSNADKSTEEKEDKKKTQTKQRCAIVFHLKFA